MGKIFLTVPKALHEHSPSDTYPKPFMSSRATASLLPVFQDAAKRMMFFMPSLPWHMHIAAICGGQAAELGRMEASTMKSLPLLHCVEQRVAQHTQPGLESGKAA